MNVHIDCARIEGKKKKRDRVIPFHQRRVIAFAHGRGDEAAFNCAAIHEKELLGTRLPAKARLPNESAGLNFGRSVPAYLNQPLQ